MAVSARLQSVLKAAFEDVAIIVNLSQFATRLGLVATKNGEIFDNNTVTRAYPEKILGD
ncbi:hypothetical protein [Dechloromonas sp. A34]|uniref:hypothetical protein n=1 Tax=Dechloromonas sp. A34 TaxID=447588 RepID=UPI0022498EDE|nr:hypothetical protein [Dechloromonas sp. A34]